VEGGDGGDVAGAAFAAAEGKVSEAVALVPDRNPGDIGAAGEDVLGDVVFKDRGIYREAGLAVRAGDGDCAALKDVEGLVVSLDNGVAGGAKLLPGTGFPGVQERLPHLEFAAGAAVEGGGNGVGVGEFPVPEVAVLY
jgi:hypothetical protein